MKNKAIAIIPARGGSKRIPKKNIKLFCGFPIIKYSIEAALNSKCFEEIIVSTDNQEIARTASSFGASVPFLRSPKTADDYSTIGEVALEVLEEYQKRGRKFSYFCCLLPTAPFIIPERIIEAYQLLHRTGAKAVLPVVRHSYPIQRALVIKNGSLEMISPENYLKRSQDLDPTFHDAGLFYWLETESFKNHKSFFPQGSMPIEINEMEVHDIDTLDDWETAELKYRIINEREKHRGAK